MHFSSIMETNHRRNMGLVDEDTNEEYFTTEPVSANGSYSRLGLEAPLLQFEVPSTKRLIKFFFCVQIVVPSKENVKEYFVSHGDQFHDNVFIAAVHEQGTPIPLAFLCVSADSYIAWMFPKDGLTSVIPRPETWCLHNSMEFCLSNIKHNLPAGEPTGLTIHIPTAEIFEEKAVAAIEQLALAKQSGEYEKIFDLISSPENGGNGNGSQGSKRGPKAPVAPLPLREKLPRGGLLLTNVAGADTTPKVNVNKILGDALADATARKEAKAAEKEAKATKKSAKAGASKAGKTPTNNKRKREKDIGLSPNPSKLKTPTIAQGNPAQPTDSTTILQPLVSALTAVVSNIAARSPTVLPNKPAETIAQPTRAELREESKQDHILRQEIRMDELKYIKEMKSIFTEHPPIATTNTSATATTISSGTTVSLESITPQTSSNINQDMDLNEAWRILSNADSWQNADEKDKVLKDQIGASSQTDLSFLDSADLKLLVGKLKLVQANRLKRALKLI